MKGIYRKFRLSTLVIALSLAVLAGGMVSCGSVRTHAGIEYENEYYFDNHGHQKKHKKPKHKKPKHHNKKHHHD